MMVQYLACFRNEKGSGPVAQLFSDDEAEIAAWVAKHDRPGFAVYRCVSPLKDGSTRRSLETVAEIDKVCIDVDFKDLEIAPQEIEDRLLQLPLQPTEVRDSGGGFHIVYLLKEAIDAEDHWYPRACALIKQVTSCLSGDPAPAHPAALLREKGSHNSKRGDPIRVQPKWGSGEAVDLTDLEAMCDLLPDEGIFPRKPKANAHGDHHHNGGNGARRDEPINVEQRLADVQFQGPGENAVHQTELHVAASLLRSGMSVQSVVLTLLEEMKKSLANDPRVATWDWEAERLKIERKCYSFVAKNPELSATLPDGIREKFEALIARGRRATFWYRRDHGWIARDAYNGKGERLGTADEAPRADEPQPGEQPRKYRFKLVSFTDLKPGAEPLYLVDELIPIAGLVDVWGKAKCFKSFWTLDLMLHVAMGWEYRERYVQQGSVVYCAFEGAHGYKKRGEALRRHYGIAPDTHVPLYVMPGQANLITEHRLLISEIAEQLGDTPPAAVVLDTLNKSLVGSENKDIDMGNYVRAAEAIRDRFRCVVIIVHHCGYDDTRPRGHSSLPGAVDAQLAVVRQEEIVTVTVEMMRDGPEETQVVSAVETIEVGQDQNGKVLTSLVVVPSEADPVGTRDANLARGLSVFLTALKASVRAHGEVFQPEPGVLPVQAVPQWQVRDRFYDTYAEAEEDEKKRQEKIRKAFNRALGDGQGKGLFRMKRTATGETMLWLPERGDPR